MGWKSLRAGLVTAAVWFTGCGDGAPDSVDSLDTAVALRVTEELRLGNVDDPELGFSRVGNIDLDRDGNLYVMETLDQEIRVFDPRGNRTRTIGGPGEGPGEFGMFSSFGVTGDTIWVLDITLRRITLFDRKGSVLSTGRLEGVPVALQTPRMEGVVMPQGLGPEGLLTGYMSSRRSRRDPAPTGVGPQDTVQVPRVRFHPSGDVADTIGWDPLPPSESRTTEWLDFGPTRYGVPLPPRDIPLEVNEPFGRWVIERPRAATQGPASMRITRLTESGDTIFSRRFNYAPVEYSEAVLDSVAWRSARVPGGSYSPVTGPRPTPEGVNIGAVKSAIRKAMRFPEFQVPVDRAHAGKDGTLWLLREDSGGPVRRWVILGPDGSLVGHLDLPRDWMVRWVGEGQFVVVDNDEYDVPWVVRLRVQP